MRGSAIGVLVCFLLAGVGWAGSPYYTQANLVDAANYAPGPFAPNSIVTLFGTELAFDFAAGGPGGVGPGALPTEIDGVQVLIDYTPTGLFYVSPGQINFLVPGNKTTGDHSVYVVRQSVHGPGITLSVAEAAPALFITPEGFAIATHVDNSVVTPEAPAHAGEVVVLYLTGLGQTKPRLDPLTLPPGPAQMVLLADLAILFDGVTLDPTRVFYAGVTPGYAGLYQINMFLPDQLGQNPEIRVAVGAQVSRAGTRIAVR